MRLRFVTTRKAFLWLEKGDVCEVLALRWSCYSTVPLASRIQKDRSKPWQGTARANRFPTSHCFYSICHAHLIPVPVVLSTMKHVGISEAKCTVAQKCNFRASILTSLLALFRLLSSHFELFVLLSLGFFHLQFLGLVSSSFLDFSSRAFWRSRLFLDFSPRVFRTSLLVCLLLLAFTCVWVPETI